MDEEALAARLKALNPTIEAIRKASGCPGASIGIARAGKVIHVEGFGYRDVERKLAPDEHTIYLLASLSKTFTASVIGKLVERGKLEWTTPVSQILPQAQHWDPVVREEANMVDYLSHRTGLAPKNNTWYEDFAQASLRREDAIPIANQLEKIAPLRSEYIYNNWGYALADEVITALSEEGSWGAALKNEIFAPLGMHRTITTRESELDKRAEAYAALTDGISHHLPRPFPEDGQIMAGAVGVQSCVSDLLLYYIALMKAAAEEEEEHPTHLPQARIMFEAHIPLSTNPSEGSYGLAWARTVLPASTGTIGLNPAYVPEMPIIGRGLEKPELCLWHQGSNNAFLHAVFLLPRTTTAIVVLSNGHANNDAADWIAQLILETVLDVPEPNDYLALAKLSARNSNALWDDMRVERKKMDMPPRALERYVGRYCNRPRNFVLEIELRGDGLVMCFQGKWQQGYSLRHYEGDVFEWLLTRDESVRRGRFPVTWKEFYLLRFRGEDEIKELVWVNDEVWGGGGF
ncbi:MAG: hypothetical protein Q9195_005722 [Heterodermia aff. obscurata]